MKNFFRSTRYLNGLIAIFVVIVGFYLSSGRIPIMPTVLTALSVFFLSCFANIHNDILDRDIDKINHPERPIASGEISIAKAKLYMYISLVLSILFALFIGLRGLLTIVFIIFLSGLYNIYLKKTLLVSNITVGLVTALVFCVPGMIMHNIKSVCIPALIAFYYNFIREIAKDGQDIEGDKKSRRITIPMILGTKQTYLLIFILLILFVPFVSIPFFLHVYGKIYILLMVFAVLDPIFIAFFYIPHNTEGFKKLSVYLKYIMLPIILTIFIGGVEFWK